MKQEVQQFLGTFSRSGEGEGGPAPKQSEDLEQLFVDLSGKARASSDATILAAQGLG